jgi:DNA-binding response OmpR family regulator
MTYTILLVEDDGHIMRINYNALAKAKYRVLQAGTLAEAIKVLETDKPDLIVLDILLPDGNGLDWCRKIRGGSQEPPVLFLSAKKDNIDVLKGFKAGGDDYLTKPYDLDILLARAERLLKKASHVPKTIRNGTLNLDIPSRQAFLSGENMGLSVTEFFLLLDFMQNEGKILKAEYLYEKIWGQTMNKDSQAIRTAVSRLRSKLEGSEFIIDFEWNEGYRFYAVDIK